MSYINYILFILSCLPLSLFFVFVFFNCQIQHASASSGLYTARKLLTARFHSGRTEPVTRAHDWTSLHFESSQAKRLCNTSRSSKLSWGNEQDHRGGNQALTWPPWQSSSPLMEFKLSQTAEEPGPATSTQLTYTHFSSHRRI